MRSVCETCENQPGRTHSQRLKYIQFSSTENRYEEEESSTLVIHVHRLLTEYVDSRQLGFPSTKQSSFMNYEHSVLRPCPAQVLTFRSSLLGSYSSQKCEDFRKHVDNLTKLTYQMVRKTEGRNHLEDSDVDGRITLK
jgi:hypothetical protein